MTKAIQQLKKSLSFLPCFNHIETIEQMHQGLSHSCFKVLSDNSVFFAKNIKDKQIEANVIKELITTKNNIYPSVIFQNKQWLITPYIPAENLAASKQPIESKIELSINLMVKFHRLNITLKPLKPFVIIEQLINKKYYSVEQQKEFIQTVAMLKESLLCEKNKKNAVCCHGDLNFSNILFNNITEQTWLIDFECSYYAAVEYDIAMFIAINNINLNLLPIITEYYQTQEATTSINKKLVKKYLMFCYFINGLWFFNKIQNTENKTKPLLLLAKKQWQAFNKIALTENKLTLNF